MLDQQVQLNKIGHVHLHVKLIAKMVEENTFLMVTKVNFKFICEVNLTISFSCFLPMLEIFHAAPKKGEPK